MTQKWVCQLNPEGYFVGQVLADESPLEEGVFLVPGGAIDVPTPTIPEGQRAKWKGEWVFENIPQPEPEPEPETEPLTPEQELEQVLNQRRFAYQQESDAIYFMWQRGEATEQEWLDAVQSIKARYPKP